VSIYASVFAGLGGVATGTGWLHSIDTRCRYKTYNKVHFTHSFVEIIGKRVVVVVVLVVVILAIVLCLSVFVRDGTGLLLGCLCGFSSFFKMTTQL